MIEVLKQKLGCGKVIRIKDEMLAIKPSRILILDIETFGENKLPGDAPCYKNHGISGIALCGSDGNSAYLVIERPDKGIAGIKLQDAIDFINSVLLPEADMLIGHNFKFDLGFLVFAGLKVPEKTKIIDTWIMSSIRCENVFTSNKLKDIAREKFKIPTEQKSRIDAMLEEKQTRDYGEILPEVLGKYACDDVIFTLMLLFSFGKISEDDWANHDRYVRLGLRLNEAERAGIEVSIPELSAAVKMQAERLDNARKRLKELLGSAEIDVENEQVFLKHLHAKNLYSPPREMFGELKYVLDREFLTLHQDHPLINALKDFLESKAFLAEFSAKHGNILPRTWFATGSGGFNVSMLQSIFSKGGLVQVKSPDLRDRVILDDRVRKFFKPRSDAAFVVLESKFLPELLLSFYCNDTDLQQGIRAGKHPARIMAERIGLSFEVCEVLWRQIIEGSGNALLEKRLRMLKLATLNYLQLRDKFTRGISGFSSLQKNIQETLKSAGVIEDRLHRRLRISEDKQYRAHAVLIGSSMGSILGFYLDLFCRVSDKCGSRLVFAHEKEFVFESDSPDAFKQACTEIAFRELVSPKPVWDIKGEW